MKVYSGLTTLETPEGVGDSLDSTAARVASNELAGPLGALRFQVEQEVHSPTVSSAGSDQAFGPSAPTAAGRPEHSKQLAFAFNASWVVNILLFVAKLYAFTVTRSKAVLASLADSGVDLASQGIIAWTDHQMKRHHPRFPVGRTRLEAIGVIGCACIMSLSSVEVIQYAAAALYDGIVNGEQSQLDFGIPMYVVLGIGTALKVMVYFVCVALQRRSDAAHALAEDHLNDILSNVAAIMTAAVASIWKRGWWVDPAAAIAISAYIIWRWILITKAQVDKIVGRAAPEDFVRQVEQLANSHHDQLLLDCIRAYHFGARFNVEMEVVLPADMSVAESHDIALDLQHKIEALEEVERCFVHVDYLQRNEPEHKVERSLLAGAKGLPPSRQASLARRVSEPAASAASFT